MFKSCIFKTLVIGTCVLFSVQSQAQNLSDPGISSHNYKMPDKAAKARFSDQYIVLTRQSFKQTFESGKARTPKYASSPSTVIEKRKSEKMSVINPLTSGANYKAQTKSQMRDKLQAMVICSLN